MAIPKRSNAMRRKGHFQPISNMAHDAQRASFPYHQDASQLPPGEKPDPIIAYQVANEANSILAGGLQCLGSGNGIITSPSGLTAFILSKSSLSFSLVFGGTTSGLCSGSLVERSMGNIKQSASQWAANLKNGLSASVPLCYNEGVVLLAALLKRNIPTSVYGHSLGAAIATFAAAMLSTSTHPISARGFCSAELGKKAIEQIQQSRNPESLKLAVSRIQHVFVQGDVVSKVGKVIPGLTHLGETKMIPHAPGMVNPVTIHDQFMRSVAFHLNEDK